MKKNMLFKNAGVLPEIFLNNLFVQNCIYSLFRNVLGTKNLGDILSDRESIAHDMQVTYDLTLN